MVLYISDIWSVEKDKVIRLERNDGMIVTSMCDVRREDRITSAVKLMARLKLDTVR